MITGGGRYAKCLRCGMAHGLTQGLCSACSRPPDALIERIVAKRCNDWNIPIGSVTAMHLRSALREYEEERKKL